MGLMGYRTPNIDRVANEGMIFTDYYGEQSCTAGRSSYITGQSVYRTGLSKVGLPGAELGIRKVGLGRWVAHSVPPGRRCRSATIAATLAGARGLA